MPRTDKGTGYSVYWLTISHSKIALKQKVPKPSSSQVQMEPKHVAHPGKSIILGNNPLQWGGILEQNNNGHFFPHPPDLYPRRPHNRLQSTGAHLQESGFPYRSLEEARNEQYFDGMLQKPCPIFLAHSPLQGHCAPQDSQSVVGNVE